LPTVAADLPTTGPNTDPGETPPRHAPRRPLRLRLRRDATRLNFTTLAAEQRRATGVTSTYRTTTLRDRAERSERRISRKIIF
jgi:hypothetical protein